MNDTEIKNNLFVIVNPNAGNGKGRKDWERISSLFASAGISASACFTTCRGNAIELAIKGIGDGFRKIITVGGDGTLNEVLNGAYTQNICRPDEICLGFIPVGTGNDWGRMFGIPLVYEGAVEVIKNGKTMLHDVGVVNYHLGEEKHTRYFINIAGVGFEAMVVKKSNRQKEKGKSNKAIYLYNLLSSLISYKNIEATITIEGKTVTNRIFSINVGNGRYCGGGMRQTPDALPDDGFLDITVIREIGRLEIIKNLKILYDGTILSHPKVDGYRTKNLKVESETLLFIEADGESLGHTPAEFSIIPSGINIIYGKRFTQ
ncbi:MAG: diacylglycerol/lipid kinase family protein [Bacteroidales bacterium]